jgi:hypothetical protein
MMQGREEDEGRKENDGRKEGRKMKGDERREERR